MNIRKYGTYTASNGYSSINREGGLWWVSMVEDEAPSMSEKLWKIREQFTTAERRLFDAIITLPPMDKIKSVYILSEYLQLSKTQIRYTLDNIREQLVI